MDEVTLHAEVDALVDALLDGDAAPARRRLHARRARYEAALAATRDTSLAAALGEALALAREAEPAAALDRLLAPALALAADAPRARARLLAARARARYLHGLVGDAADDAEAALAALADAPRADRLRLRVALLAAAIDRDVGQLARGRTRAAEVRALALAAGDTHHAAWGALHEASAALMAGDVAAARSGYDATLGAASALGMRRVEALATLCLGHCDEKDGRFDDASARFRRAAASFEALGDPLFAAKIAVREARLALERGQTGAAIARAEDAERQAAALDDRDTRVRAALVFGRARLAAALDEAAQNGFVSVLAQPLDVPRARGAPPLRVAPDAAWFEPPGGRRVDLRTRAPLRRVLAHLIDRRLARAHRAATTDDLVRAGWPAERILVEAARDRVYSAVGMLRRMGLGPLLVRQDGGYALDPDVPVVVVA